MASLVAAGRRSLPSCCDNFHDKAFSQALHKPLDAINTRCRFVRQQDCKVCVGCRDDVKDVKRPRTDTRDSTNDERDGARSIGGPAGEGREVRNTVSR